MRAPRPRPGDRRRASGAWSWPGLLLPATGQRARQAKPANACGLQLGGRGGRRVEDDHVAVVVVHVDEMAGDLPAAESTSAPDETPGVLPRGAGRADDVVPVVHRRRPELREAAPSRPAPPPRSLVTRCPGQGSDRSAVDPVVQGHDSATDVEPARPGHQPVGRLPARSGLQVGRRSAGGGVVGQRVVPGYDDRRREHGSAGETGLRHGPAAEQSRGGRLVHDVGAGQFHQALVRLLEPVGGRPHGSAHARRPGGPR